MLDDFVPFVNFSRHSKVCNEGSREVQLAVLIYYELYLIDLWLQVGRSIDQFNAANRECRALEVSTIQRTGLISRDCQLYQLMLFVEFSSHSNGLAESENHRF